MESKKKAVIISAIGVTVFGAIFSSREDAQEKTKIDNSNRQIEINEPVVKEPDICDGINIVQDCILDGIEYSKYKYYPAVAEKSHVETVTTYKKKVTGYCTKCNDGTYSPTCATGRGTCSHHGGVAQWNAPVYSNVPEYTKKKVIDSKAVPEYYEKVAK